MTRKPLTSQQTRALEFLEEYGRENGFPPTFREIGEAIGLRNVSAVRGHVAALEKKGHISRTPEKARSTQIVHHAPSRLSRFKRKLHEWARTNEGALHHLRYGPAVVTWQRTAWFAAPLKKSAEKLWARGFVATTDLTILDELVAQLLAEAAVD